MSKLRVGGLISGLDTDGLVKALTLAQQNKIDQLKQKNELGTWKQTEYRNIIDKMNAFKNKYLSTNNPLTNLGSKSVMNAYTSTVTNSSGASSSAVSVSASGNLNGLNHTISVQSLAQKEVWQSSAPTKMESQEAITQNNLKAINDAIASGSPLKFSANVDGQIKEIALTGGANGKYNDATELATDLQSKLNAAYGENKVTVGTSTVINGEDGKFVSGKLTFSTAGENGKSNGHTFGLGNTPGAAASIQELGFTGVTWTSLQTDKTLNELNLASPLDKDNNQIKFTINGKEFAFDKTQNSMQDIFNTVNSSDAGVRMYYSEVNNAVIMESKATGEANQISWSDDSNNLLTSLFGEHVSRDAATAAGRLTAGKDAEFTLDGIATKRSSNMFTMEGVTYTLNQPTNGDLNVNLKADTSKAKEAIIQFVNDYNDLIKYINGKTREEKLSGYNPLTEDQRAGLTEYEMKDWEEKAKQGIVRNDPMLRDAMNAISNSVFMTKSGGMSAYSLGIQLTGAYSDGGLIKLDLDQLDKALAENPNGVGEFFTGENGLAAKMSEAIDSYASTDLLTQGKLVSTAGYAGKSSEYFNSISEEARARNKQITELLEKLVKKQDDLYAQYAKMEVQMNKMQQQLSSMMSQIG